MLQAYVDDSNSNIADRRLFLAAWTHDALSWADFSDEWDAALHEAPVIDYFKMKEAQRRDGQFQKFSEGQRDRKVLRMAEVIQRFRPRGFHSSVSIVDYRAIFEPLAPHPLKTPYFPLCYAIMFGIARVHEEAGIIDPCEFVFDHNDGLAAKVVPLFDVVMTDRPPELRKLIAGTPAFRDDKEILPIQAADMLAWHVRRRSDGNYPEAFERLDDMLIDQGMHYYTEIDRQTLHELAEGMRGVPGAGQINNKRQWERLLPFVRYKVDGGDR